MRRTAYYCHPGNLRNLERRDEELAAPLPHEVQVEVRAVGLNFADVFAILGLYEAAPKTPFIPGLEYSGIVDAVGDNVTDFKRGDRVMGVSFFGAYATALNVDARFVRHIPVGWTFEDGAACIVASLTAYYGLIDQCRLKKGETVLIQSAAGGVGLAALKIAKKYGCFVIGAVGSESKRSFCMEQGYDRVVVRGRTFKRQLQDSLAGRELNVVMEAIGGQAFKDSYALLAPRGRIAIYGFAEFMPKNVFSYVAGIWKYLRRPRIDTLNLNNRLVAGFNLIYLFSHVEDIKKYVDEIDALGVGKPYIGAAYPFEELPAALSALKSRETVGKVVVKI